MRLGDPIDGGESGGQYPRGRNEHPWAKKSGSKKSRSKTLKDSHPAKVLQSEPGGKSGAYAHTIDDRLRQQTRRSRIHGCRVTSHDLDCGLVNAQLGEKPLRPLRLCENLGI